MATAYHRDDAGAPALAYSTAVNSVEQFAALKTILKACLVEGYGAKPAAGWFLINEGSNFLVLRTGTQSGYVCLTWMTGIFRVYLSETYTGMAGDVMVGDGLKTGNASGNTLPQVLSAFYFAHSPANSSWAVVADSKTFVVSLISNTGNQEITNQANNTVIGATLYAGEDSNGFLIAVGGQASASTATGTHQNTFSAKAGFTALKYPGTGLLVGSQSIEVAAPAISNNTAIWNGIYVLPVATLAPLTWFGNSSYGGALRGIALVPELVTATYASLAAQSLGRAGPMYIRDGSSPINLGDGHSYFARMGSHLTAPFFLLTDNPEFW